MLNLNAGVHLDEVVLAALAVYQELHGTGIDITNMLGNLNGVCAQCFDGLLGNGPGGCILYHLLVAALQRAIALAQMHHVAVLVGQNLHFDVLGLDQELFNEDIFVAEGFLSFVLDQLELATHIFLGVAAAHTAATAAGSGLQDDGEAVADGLLNSFIGALQRLGRAGDDGYIAGQCGGLCGQLVAHLTQNMRGRTDKLDAVLFAGTGEVGVFGQEAIAGMDGIDATALGQVDDGGNVQISAQGGLIFTNQISLVGLGAELAAGVFVGIHGNGVQIKVVTGTENTDGNLAAVGDENFGKVFRHNNLLSPGNDI